MKCPIKIDAGRREVRRWGKRVRLNPKRYAIVCCIAEHHPRAATDHEIGQAAWGFYGAPSQSALDQQVRRARLTLRELGVEIARVQGLGYVFEKIDRLDRAA